MKTVTIVQTINVEITDAEAALIVQLYAREQKVTAVKFLKDQYGLCLKTAKDVCDKVGYDRMS